LFASLAAQKELHRRCVCSPAQAEAADTSPVPPPGDQSASSQPTQAALRLSHDIIPGIYHGTINNRGGLNEQGSV